MAARQPIKQMDFFAEQRSRTRRSLLLYGLFFLFISAHVVVALGIMALLMTVFTDGFYHWVMVLVVLFILLSFLLGSYLEYRRLRAGGRAIAKRVGAVRLFIDHSQDEWVHSAGVAHQHERPSPVRYTAQHITVRTQADFPPVYRRYYEFAQQLAIASGVGMPILYVLPNEQGINGFVAGRQAHDMVMVVTQGALDKLSDEGLYGLLGHEYGHIKHGDARFNLQLMVVLAGLQLLYDWSDPIVRTATRARFDDQSERSLPANQRHIDAQARFTEAQTAHFTTHAEWVAYWQQSSSSHQHQAPTMLQGSTLGFGEPIARSPWRLVIHGLSFSSMASAQLIKHSFNRERELLADATSVQLTRSPAILETLKTIHQDALGSRLSYIADMNGLSHFFFASSGADLGDVSWFSTHPSLAERMQAVSDEAYQDFSQQVHADARRRKQHIKEIYAQRRRGDWTGTIAPPKPPSPQDEADDEAGLSFTPEQEVVIDGRLQVDPKSVGRDQLLKPWQAQPHNNLPTTAAVKATDISKVSLPQYVVDHSYHPLGALALIEAALLCHQGRALSKASPYGLTPIWCPSSANCLIAHQNTAHDPLHDSLAHRIDQSLLEAVAKLDRRLDQALIVKACALLSKHDLSASAISRLHHTSKNSHDHQTIQAYKKQYKYRTMLLRYQQGLLRCFEQHVAKSLTETLDFNEHTIMATADRTFAPLSALWQALQLQLVWPVLFAVLNEAAADDETSVSVQAQQNHILQAGVQDIMAQLDPSGQTFSGLSVPERVMLILFAYRLSVGGSNSHVCSDDKAVYVLDLRRHARLIDIDISTVSDANLQWLLLTAQHLNSIQFFALLECVPAQDSEQTSTVLTNETEKSQQNRGQIDYNTYRRWLSTLHTIMLHDTIISQDEYDCLTACAQRWIGTRTLID